MFYYNFVDLCNQRGLSPSAAAEAMGLKKSVVTRWKNGTKPRQATLQKIASFFGCSIEDLTKEKTPATISDEREDVRLMIDDITRMLPRLTAQELEDLAGQIKKTILGE